MRVNLLSGGAAQGLVRALAPLFETETGAAIDGTFGAVGAMREKLAAGAPADVLILTSALMAELVREGRVDAGSIADIGAVETAIAVRTGDPLPGVGSSERLGAALLAADAIYFPDPERATAGIHFSKVLEAAGIHGAAREARAKTYPNGAAAMSALATSAARNPIGCTQATEILSTPGVTLVAPLPEPFALATVYTAGVSATARAPREARALCALLARADTAAAREAAGFR